MAVLGITAGGCAWLEVNAQKQALEAQDLVQRGRQARDQEQMDRASELLTGAVSANPKDSDAHRELAIVLHQQDRSDEALEHLRFATELEPQDVLNWVSLAEILKDRGEFNRMQQPLAVALSIDPMNLKALWLSAELAERHQRDQQALELCLRIRSLAPNHVDASLLMADIYLKRRQSDRAAPLLRHLLERGTLDSVVAAESQWKLGVAYGVDRRWNDAATELENSLIRGKLYSPDDLYRIAYAHYQAGASAEATRFATEVLKRKPDDMDAQRIAGLVRSAQTIVQTSAINVDGATRPGSLSPRVPPMW